MIDECFYSLTFDVASFSECYLLSFIWLTTSSATRTTTSREKRGSEGSVNGSETNNWHFHFGWVILE